MLGRKSVVQGGGGGTPRNSRSGVTPGFQNSDQISDQNMPRPFSDLAS